VRLSRLGRLQRRDRYHAFYHEGARPDGLFVLLSGAVRLQAGGDEAGRNLKPPCVFGLESLAALGETALGIRPVERLEEATSTLPSVVVHVPGALMLSAILEQAATLDARTGRPRRLKPPAPPADLPPSAAKRFEPPTTARARFEAPTTARARFEAPTTARARFEAPTTARARFEAPETARAKRFEPPAPQTVLLEPPDLSPKMRVAHRLYECSKAQLEMGRLGGDCSTRAELGMAVSSSSGKEVADADVVRGAATIVAEPPLT
jgi:hypothetical protein